MSIVRASRKDTYTNIDNKLINDPALDWKDLGLLVFLLSKPDNWSINAEHLAKQRKLGKDGIYSGLKAICNAGYASKKPNPKGGWDWVISDEKDESLIAAHETPVTMPNRENPNTENPNRENPVLVNTDKTITTDFEKREDAPKKPEILAEEKPAKAEKENPEKKWDWEKDFDFAFALAYLISKNRVSKDSNVDGISMDLWYEWQASRKASRKAKMSETSLTTCLQDLIEINEAGLDANEAMREAIKREWIGLGHWIEKMKLKPNKAMNGGKPNRDFANPPKYSLDDDFGDSNAIDSFVVNTFAQIGAQL